MRARPQRPFSRNGYTTVELLLVIALSAMIMGGVVVSFGSLVRNQPRVASTITVPLGETRHRHFYGTSRATREAASAPHYGMLALAEELREQFYADVMSATAVFCLPRESHNTWKPSTIPYNPAEHGELDTPQKFRSHIIAAAGVSPLLYRDYRNPQNTSDTQPSPHASIFILGYSKEAGKLKVSALYDVDVIRFTGAAQPQGFHTSVKRYADDPGGLSLELVFAGGYDLFYPPSLAAPASAAAWQNDGFAPLFITFERSTRRALAEGTAIDRFKVAAERPFYFIWWPDPAMRHLGPQTTTASPSTPQQAYSHMAGRTSFMFTVPMFPAL
jgi:hypothetical protein